MKRLLVLLIICMALSAAATVATADLTGPTDYRYYVDWQNGDDFLYDGKSWQTAKQTIQAAIDKAASDGLGQVWVRSGEYQECIYVQCGISIYGGFDGTESDRRERKPWQNVTTIEGDNTAWSVVELDYLTKVDGFTISNGTYGVTIDSDDWVSHNVIFAETCVVCGGGYACVTDNLLISFYGYGVRGGRADVRNNTVVGYDNSAYCGVEGSSQYPELGYCINNIITGCQYGIMQPPYYTSNNDIWGNGDNTRGSNDISENPKFVNPDPQSADYRLCYGSPCINAGADIAPPGEIDLDGHPRMQNCPQTGECLDIGAYEYGVSEAVTVSIEFPDGDTWVFEPCERSKVIEISASTNVTEASIAHVDLWVDGTRVDPAPTYNPSTELWTCTWELPTPAPSQIAVRARATDTEGNYGECALTVTLDVQGPPYVVYVKPEDNSGTTHNGESWYTAFHSIQDAIDAAFEMDDPKGEVWVAAWANPEHDPYLGYWVLDYPNSVLVLASGVAVYGGFAGTECTRAARNWHDNETTIVALSTSGAGLTADNVGAGTRLDGFTVTQGGPALSSTDSYLVVANNTFQDNTYAVAGGAIYCTGGTPVITRNTITGNTATTAGGAIYCDSSSARIADNVIADNTSSGGNGGGIYVASGSPHLANNTLTGNTASSGGGVYVDSGSPDIVNNIVASNSHGIWWPTGASPSISYNDVWDNSGGNYPSGGDLTGIDHNISVDPAFLPDGYHISGQSPCAGKGDNDAVDEGETDIDGQPRIKPANGGVDIGADESDNCGWHLTLTMSPQSTVTGGQITVSCEVLDDNGEPVGPDEPVDFAVVEGDGSVSPTTADTNSQGIATTVLTSSTAGSPVVQASYGECDHQTARAYFHAPGTGDVSLVFVIDATGSTQQRWQSLTNGICQTVDYLVQQLQAQGRLLTVAAIKFSDDYTTFLIPANEYTAGEMRGFATMDTAAAITGFEDWISEDAKGGGTEYQLDILEYGKDLAPEAVPGLYIALATDEDSDSEDPNEHSPPLSRFDVADDLTDAGCIVFIDPAEQSLVSYYGPLAVNGGAVESTSLGYFTFPLMRQAILSP